MRKLFLFSIVSILISCGGSGNTITVNGEVFGGETLPNSVVIKSIRTAQVIDTVDLVDGKYTFTTTLDTADIYSIKHNMNILFAVAEPGNVNVVVNADRTHRISGTALNDALQMFHDSKDSLNNALNLESAKLKKKYENDVDKYQKELTSYYENVTSKEILKLNSDIVANNDSNILGTYMYLDMYAQVADLDSIYAFIKKNPTADGFAPLMRVKRIKANLKSTLKGQMFIDFTGHNIDNTEDIKLSEYVAKGNYVALYYWASWNKKSVDDLVVMNDLYERYKKKGLVVLAVNMWDTVKSAEKVIEGGDTTLPLIFSHGDEDLALSYGVVTLPYVILFDRDGTIVSRDLYGEALEEEIAKLHK